MGDLAIKAVLAYLLGAVLGSLVLGRLRGIDIRKQGSGNAGGTNALRTQGKWFGLGVIVIDIGKGALAAGVLPMIPLAAIWSGQPEPWMWQATVCGAAAVIGHVWPVWFGFRGGKGAATLVGVMLVVAPWLLPLVIGVWLVSLVLSGYVGLSTMLGAASAPLAVLLFSTFGLTSPLFLFTLVMAGFIVYTHRSNIQRMRAGTEHQFERVMLFRQV